MARKSAAPAHGIPAAIWTLGFVSMFMDISSEMIHALLPVYLVQTLKASMASVGVIEGVAEAAASFTRIFSGALSDWMGNRKLLAVLGYGMAALSKPAFPLAPSVSWVAAARFVDRVGKGIRGAPRDALVADIAPAHLRGASFGLRQALDTVGAFVGPLIAMLLLSGSIGNVRRVFWIAVLPAAVSVLLLLFFVHEPRVERQPGSGSPLTVRQMRRLGPAFWSLLAVASLLGLARFSEAFLVLRAQSLGVPLTLIPAVLLVMNVVYSLAAYPAGKLSDRTGRTHVLTAGLALLGLADVFLAISGSLDGVFTGIALWGFHMAFTQGILTTWVADVAPADLRGTAFGVFHLAVGLATLAGSSVAGLLWDISGPRATFLTGAGLAVAALAALLSRNRLQNG